MTPPSSSAGAGHPSSLNTSEPGNKVVDSAIKHDSNENNGNLKKSTMRTVVSLISVFVSMFLVALDRTIITTAIPRITDEFNSLPDVGWYGSAYLLTMCSFQLLFGKIYTLYSVKIVLLASVLLFEISSALCGAAPNSTAFIVGRALSGVGAAGIMSGVIVCIVYTVPLEKRPALQGCFGALMGFASIVGPLIGGAFTSNITWRWCFYINLPFGGVAMIVIASCLKIPDRETTKVPWKQKLLQLDALGTAALVPGVICLLLALQWGGQTYAWSNVRIIVLLIIMAVLLTGFVAIQILRPETAVIPPRVFKQRSIAAGAWASLCIGASQYVYTYFLPIWFQSISGVSPVQSGIRLLPLMLSMVVSVIFSGITTKKIGYYTPYAIFGSCIMSIGAGLLTTLQVHTSKGKWIGYQILYGLGMGFCFQQPNLAAQTVLPKKDVPLGIAVMIFCQVISGAVFVSVSENVLDSQLLHRLSSLPGFTPSLVTSGGATQLLRSLPDYRETILVAYNEALRKVFQIGLILSCLTVLGTFSLEWKSIVQKPEANAESKAVESAEEKTDESNIDGKTETESKQ